MFINVQEPNIMKAQKNHLVSFLTLILAGLLITSCSSVGDIPKDDIYYARGTNNPGEYNWDDFEKNADDYGSKTVKTNTSNGDSFDYNSTYQDDVAAKGSSDSEYDYIDEQYDDSYESRINRFGSNSNSSDFGYYDGYNTGNCGCNSGSNFSIGFGMSSGYGMGYGGWGWQTGYGYGWPNYYYPSYYYDPFYGYNSYMMGYSAGYNAGYWNGYYGGYYPPYGGYYPPYGGGYYPEYGYGPAVAYGPRGSGVTGTTIPRNRGGGGGSTSSPGTGNSGDNTYVSGGAISSINRGGATVGASSGQTASNTTSPRTNGRSIKIGKPGNETTTTQGSASQNIKRGDRNMIYQKPKSYQNLSNQNSTGSRSEYVRPTNKKIVGSENKTRTRNVRTNPTTTSNLSNSKSRNNDIYKSSRSRSSFGSSTSRKSYSSPSRSNSSSRSYSSPSRSTSTGASHSRSSSYSSGSSSRSNSGSSSSGSSRSSGSSSGSGVSPRRR